MREFVNAPATAPGTRATGPVKDGIRVSGFGIQKTVAANFANYTNTTKPKFFKLY